MPSWIRVAASPPSMPPGLSTTYAYGINDSGQIVGYFVDASGSHGFVDTGGTFTTLPGIATGINNSGQIVGTFGLDTGGTLYGDQRPWG